jgi:hypothetical protein
MRNDSSFEKCPNEIKGILRPLPSRGPEPGGGGEPVKITATRGQTVLHILVSFLVLSLSIDCTN